MVKWFNNREKNWLFSFLYLFCKLDHHIVREHPYYIIDISDAQQDTHFSISKQAKGLFIVILTYIGIKQIFDLPYSIQNK
jgi:hypothetical protein